jgi:ubiquinone/menaquinone biosynthesis C-methylase UbiE
MSVDNSGECRTAEQGILNIEVSDSDQSAVRYSLFSCSIFCCSNVRYLRMTGYHPKEYWNEVAQRITTRSNGNLLAGDEEPYYNYKRKEFLRLLHQIPFENKNVLELGCGTGLNLQAVLEHSPASLTGADIAEKMLAIAARHIPAGKAELILVNGTYLPFPSQHFDLSFTSTVLQHITDENMLKHLLQSLCDVTKYEIYLFERVSKKPQPSLTNTGRTVEEYKQLMLGNCFELAEVRYLDTSASYWVSGVIRKVFNRPGRKEGEPVSSLSKRLQRFFLFFTKPFDKLIVTRQGLAMLKFKKISQE